MKYKIYIYIYIHIYIYIYIYIYTKMAPRCCPRAKMQGTYCARRGIALLAASSPCWSLANRNELIYWVPTSSRCWCLPNRNELIYRVYTMRDLFVVPQYTIKSTRRSVDHDPPKGRTRQICRSTCGAGRSRPPRSRTGTTASPCQTW